jgi:hypothetical protein
MEESSESPFQNGNPPVAQSADGPTAESEDQPAIDPRRMAELCCWFVVVLAPILTWVNGPAVSTDQFVVRTIVFCAALTGGIVFSVANFLRWRRQKQA